MPWPPSMVPCCVEIRSRRESFIDWADSQHLLKNDVTFSVWASNTFQFGFDGIFEEEPLCPSLLWDMWFSSDLCLSSVILAARTTVCLLCEG